MPIKLEPLLVDVANKVGLFTLVKTAPPLEILDPPLRARLDIKNERARAKRRAETEEQKKERLEKRNASDRARRSAEKPIEKKTQLDKTKTSLQMNLLSKELKDWRT